MDHQTPTAAFSASASGPCGFTQGWKIVLVTKGNEYTQWPPMPFDFMFVTVH